jgi:hypothetical protein
MRLLILVLLLVPCALALELSEILPNPDGSDNGLEFIELIGEENLSGCIVSDSASSDVLIQLAASGAVALIVEEDGPYARWENATVYSAGKAIGNGLGNAQDTIAIACNGTVLVNASYDTAAVPGYEQGYALLWLNGSWAKGAFNGTPGGIGNDAGQSVPNATTSRPPATAQPAHGGSGGGGASCNSTLAISLSAPTAHAGEETGIRIDSPGFASFEASANGEILLAGDTLHGRGYALSLPDAQEVIVRAYANECDASQRATRRIAVMSREEIIQEEPVQDAIPERQRENSSAGVTAAARAPPPSLPPEERKVREGEITGNVVYEQEPNLVPWVSGFGAAVLLVCAWLFRNLKNQESA